MKNDTSAGTSMVAAAASLAVALLAIALPSRAVPPPNACCFANERYEGVCTVVPGEGETCEGILGYLNNPMSTGKSYCGGAGIRGGWAQVDCKTGNPSARQTATGSAAKVQSPASAQANGASK